MAGTFATGLDIGTSSIRVVVCDMEKYQAGNASVIASIEAPSRGLRHGYVISADEVTESVRHALELAEGKIGQRIKSVALGIGGITLLSQYGDGSVAISRADQEVTDLDIERVTENSEANLKDIVNRKILWQHPLYYKIDGKRVLGRPKGQKGAVLEVRTLFITSLKQHAEDLVEAVEDASVRVTELTPAPISAGNLILTKAQKTAGVVLANIGSETVSLVVYEDGIPLSLTVFPFGSEDITKDIALGLRVTLEEAEELKTGKKEAGGGRRKLDDIMEARLSDILELAQKHLKAIGRNGMLPAGIVLTGGGSRNQNLEQMARNFLTLPSRLLREIPHIPESVDPVWSVALGLALAQHEPKSLASGSGQMLRSLSQTIITFLKNLMP